MLFASMPLSQLIQSLVNPLSVTPLPLIQEPVLQPFDPKRGKSNGRRMKRGVWGLGLSAGLGGVWGAGLFCSAVAIPNGGSLDYTPLTDPTSNDAPLYPVDLANPDTILPLDATLQTDESTFYLADSLDLDPEIIDNSPVLQRWLEEVPDILSDIKNDPSFRSRIRLGYVGDLSDHDGGLTVGIEDVFLGRTGLTFSGDYRTILDDDDYQYGVDIRYYLLPLGQQVNVAPVIGYRNISTNDHDVDGVNVGIRLLLVPSRSGAADLSLTQTWVAPGRDRESLSRFTFSTGYAVTQTVRLSGDIHIQTSERDSQTEFGLLLEWML